MPVSVFVPVPVPWSAATPIEPWKSVISDGSAPCPGRKTWKTSVPGPKGWMPPGMGLGAFPCASANPGIQSPEPSTTPVVAAAAVMNWRRDSRARSQK